MVIQIYLTTLPNSNVLTGKVVVVTGGAGLLGASICSEIKFDGGLPIADISTSLEGAYELLEVDCTCEDQFGMHCRSTASYGLIHGAVHAAYPHVRANQSKI